jgi:hypothetical protein
MLYTLTVFFELVLVENAVKFHNVLSLYEIEDEINVFQATKNNSPIHQNLSAKQEDVLFAYTQIS